MSASKKRSANHTTVAKKATNERTASSRKALAAATPDERPPESKRLYLTSSPGETNKQAMARHVVRPEVNAASTISLLNVSGFAGPDLDLTTLMNELQTQSDAVNSGKLARGEAMLAAQAQTLDAMFHHLMRKALAQGQLQQYETFMRLGMKAQAQCRTTWEAISEIKNPRSIAFVRQANIANGHQQVNNGTLAGGREIESSPTKLLETTRNEWMDPRATSKAGRGDQTLEAVGAINGTAQ